MKMEHPLTKYQDKFVKDTCAIKIMAHARRVGGTHAAAEFARNLMMGEDTLYSSERRVLWIGPSGLRGLPTKDVALLKHMGMDIVDYDPSEIRGYSQHVILDSPDLIEDHLLAQIMDTVYHVVSPTLRNGVGCTLTMTGQMTRGSVLDAIKRPFWHQEPVLHVVDIHTARSHGSYIDPASIADLPEIVQEREYLVNWPRFKKDKALSEFENFRAYVKSVNPPPPVTLP